MSVKLTKDRYDQTDFGERISWGIIENSSDGCFMTSDEDGPEYLIWGAWKGQGNDWGIYVCPFPDGPSPIYDIEDTLEDLHYHGDKLFSEETIRSVIDADPEVMKLYRK